VYALLSARHAAKDAQFLALFHAKHDHRTGWQPASRPCWNEFPFEPPVLSG
jgi:hypothetical protein